MNKPPEQRGRLRQCDIMKGQLGLRTVESRSCSTPCEVFELLVTPAMVGLVIQSTNDRIKETIASLVRMFKVITQGRRFELPLQRRCTD